MMPARVIQVFLQTKPKGWRSRRKYRHLCNAWAARMGKDPLTQRNLQRFREVCRNEGLSPNTYETQISDLVTAAKAAGLDLTAGHRDRRPRPEPDILTPQQIGKAYRSVGNTTWPGQYPSTWWRAAIVIVFWSCLRRQDIATLRWDEIDLDSGLLRRTANKTGHRHVVPLPGFVQRHLQLLPRICEYVFALPTYFEKSLLHQCRKISADSAVRVTPQEVRRAGLTAWSAANPMAGRIIHGSGLGVLDHYVNPLTVLQSAAPRVSVPDEFLTVTERQERQAGLAEVSERFAALDPVGQSTVLDLMRRIA